MKTIYEISILRQPFNRSHCAPMQEPGFHVWERFGKEMWLEATQEAPGHFEVVAILVLCTNCGRTPNEVLDEMPVSAGGRLT